MHKHSFLKRKEVIFHMIHLAFKLSFAYYGPLFYNVYFFLKIFPKKEEIPVLQTNEYICKRFSSERLIICFLEQ